MFDCLQRGATSEGRLLLCPPAGHDTNIYIINAKPPAVLARFQQYRAGDVGLCSVVAAELAFGVAKSGSARNRQALEMFLAPLTILPF